MDITFDCDKCGQNIVIDEAGAGTVVDCPKCGTSLEHPHKSPRRKPESSPQPKRPSPFRIIGVVVIALFCALGFVFFRDYTLNGEVFIVTKGGESIKLGLVPIGLISLADLTPYLKDKETTASNELARLEPLIKTTEGNFGVYKMLVEEQDHYYGGFYFDSLPLPIKSAKTDADGRFRIQVPRFGRFALAAVASRQVGEDILGVEKYYWLVEISPQNESSRGVITLSNDNLFHGVHHWQ